MASNIRLRFRGVKECSLCIPMGKIESVWSKLLEGTYRIPKCSKCRNLLEFKSMYLDIGATLSIPRSQMNVKSENLKITFDCSHCNFIIEGYGFGLKISQSGDFTLQKIIVKNEI